MNLANAVSQYLELKKGMGMRFNKETQELRALCKAVGDRNISDVKSSSVLALLGGCQPGKKFQHRKWKTLKGFYRFAMSRGYVRSSPLPTVVPKEVHTFTPYIYTTEEIQRLLANLYRLDSRGVRSDLFRALLLTLYSTGLRLGEALALKTQDVDLDQRLILVQQAKFYKERLVPIGPRLAAELKAYRIQGHYPQEENRPFFAKHNGMAIQQQLAQYHFRNLCRHCGIHRTDASTYQPRLHDLRHTAAVNRIVAWYKAGKDVQRLLLPLSVYLGHATLKGTSWYLTLIPELLRQRTRRFERFLPLNAKTWGVK